MDTKTATILYKPNFKMGSLITYFSIPDPGIENSIPRLQTLVTT